MDNFKIAYFSGANLDSEPWLFTMLKCDSLQFLCTNIYWWELANFALLSRFLSLSEEKELLRLLAQRGAFDDFWRLLQNNRWTGIVHQAPVLSRGKKSTLRFVPTNQEMHLCPVNENFWGFFFPYFPPLFFQKILYWENWTKKQYKVKRQCFMYHRETRI